MGDVTTDITTALNDATTAYVASTCPTGTALTNLGVCQPIGTAYGSATGSNSNGGFVLLLLLVVVVMAGGK